MRRIIVVGGGASGMMAAGRAAECGGQVVLLERTAKLGNKLRITGKGRCNITNMAELDEFIQNYGENGRFLYSCFSRFFNHDLIEFFESRGVQTVVERGGRVFPKSNEAGEVVKCLINYLKSTKVLIRTNFRVSKVILDGNKIIGVEGKDEIIEGDAVIIATGGMSYQSTGSSGDGYKLAEELGHRIIPPTPGLVGLEIEEPYVKELAGLSLKNVSVSGLSNGKEFVKMFGEMLFTHFGLSGPVILTLSHNIVQRLKLEKVTLSINFKPALTKEMLEKRVLRELNEYGKMKFKNILKHLLPNKAIPVFIKLLRITEDKKCGEIDKAGRQRLIELLSDFKMQVKCPRPIEEAIITSGGVALNEINPKTMESKKLQGLFFSGEVIDIDGNTGGYNLQSAFSSGYVAGESAAKG
ncbi:NAD(P)/FAD-dependent oxidoreductase [bacterium]|nr:NAD(P)/FAD-dependent oxidoreductase [bacterium]